MANKLDPRLRHLLRQAALTSAAEAVSLAPTPRVEVLVRCAPDASLAGLVAAGLRLHSSTRGAYLVAAGDVDLQTLETLPEQPGVLEIEASRRMLADCDLSRAATGVDRLHRAEVPQRGAGVIVGIIDSGIDFTHPAFRRAEGSSRILFLWDQGGRADGQAAVPYGVEYTKAQLDAALAGPDPLQVVPHRDIGGHGTHVAGIAAGGGGPGGAFTGMAPDADLIFVAYRPEADTLGRSARALAAFSYIAQRAQGRPVAINMSQGMNGGGHSGETALETGLDDLLRTPGLIAVKSAGNEGDWRVHAGGRVPDGGMVTLSLLSESRNNLDDVLEIWFDGGDGISVAVRPPGGVPTAFVAPGESGEFQTAPGNGVSIASDRDASDTGDTRVTIILNSGQASFIQPGTWSVLLRGDAVEDGRFDAWIERTARDQGLGEQSQFTEASADPSRTISIPGTARRIITVASYVTRPLPGLGAPLGQISTFSSRGPTRYGAQKPEIAAPGESIVAARSSASRLPEDPDEWHTPMLGTSMAAPHVTGAAALLLGVRPDLTCEQLKQILVRTSRRDGFAASAPDNAWGSGKIDMTGAIENVAAIVFPRIRGVAVDGAVVSWQTDIPTTSAVRFHTHKRQLELGRNTGSQADLVLGTDHRIDLGPVLAPDTTYFCEILAFSTDTWWTSEDADGRFYEASRP